MENNTTQASWNKSLCVGPIFSYISALLFFIPSPKVAVHSEKSGGQDKICVLYQTIRQILSQQRADPPKAFKGWG